MARSELDESQQRQIRQTVKMTKGYWRRGGVPLAQRRRMAEDLADHLSAALADEHQVRDVIGDDLPAFAASWAQADVERPWLSVLLQLLSLVLLLPGVHALVVAALGDGRSGFEADRGIWLLAFALWLGGLTVLRTYRARLRERQAIVVVVALLVVYAAIGIVWQLWAMGGDVFLAVPPPLAWGLVVAGLACWAVWYALRRTQRL